MSIESSLERIASALETMAYGPGSSSVPKKPEEEVKPSKDTTEDTSSSKPKSTSKPAAKPTKSKTTDEGAPTIGDVRKALGTLQKATSADEARALLKRVGGATTMSKLEPENYQAVIDAALEAAEA